MSNENEGKGIVHHLRSSSEYKEVTVADIRKWCNEVDGLGVNKPREFVIFTSRPMIDMFNATVDHLQNPTEQSNQRIDDLYKANTDRLNKNQQDEERNFVSKYGETTLAFIKSLPNKDWFLVGNSLSDYYLKWQTDEQHDESEFTDTWYVEFHKGKFHYKVSWSNGYDGVDMLEEDISHQKVLELLKYAK